MRGGVFLLDRFDLFPGIVGGISFHENELRMLAHLRRAQDRIFDVAAFVAGRDDDAYAVFVIAEQRAARVGTREGEDIDRQPAEEEEIAEEHIEEPREERDPYGEDHPLVVAVHFQSGELQQPVNVFQREPVLQRHLAAQPDPRGEFQQRLPEVIVVGDDHFRVAVHHLVQAFEKMLHVVDVTDEVGDHDEIEFFRELQLFRIHLQELDVRIFFARFFQHRRAEINADFAFAFQLPDEIARSATDLQHADLIVRKIVAVLRDVAPVVRTETAFALFPGETIEIRGFAAHGIGCKTKVFEGFAGGMIKVVLSVNEESNTLVLYGTKEIRFQASRLI